MQQQTSASLAKAAGNPGHTVEFVTLALGERDWVLRALDLDQLEALQPQFAVIGSAMVGGGSTISKEARQAVVDIAFASLQFKQPDVTPDQVRKLITLGTLRAVLEAVCGVSQLNASGEVLAG